MFNRLHCNRWIVLLQAKKGKNSKIIFLFLWKEVIIHPLISQPIDFTAFPDMRKFLKSWFYDIFRTNDKESPAAGQNYPCNYRSSILISWSAYAIMSADKRNKNSMYFNYSKSPEVATFGAFCSLFEMEGLKSTGSLPTIGHYPTIWQDNGKLNYQ